MGPAKSEGLIVASPNIKGLLAGPGNLLVVTWKGGEVQKFDGFTVQAIHARHAGGRPEPVNKLMTLYEELVFDFYGRPQTEDEKAA